MTDAKAEEIRGLLGAFATIASYHQSCLMCGSEEERDEAAVGVATYEGHEPSCLVLKAWAALEGTPVTNLGKYGVGGYPPEPVGYVYIVGDVVVSYATGTPL